MCKYVFMYFYFMLPEIQMKEHISFTDMQVRIKSKRRNKAQYFNGILEKVN